MKLGEYVIPQPDKKFEQVIEVHHEESTGKFQFQPLVRQKNKTLPLFVTIDQIRTARREVLNEFANKTDFLHRYVEIVIPRRSHTEDTFALVGAYVEHQSIADPSMLLRKIRIALERWVNTRKGRAFEFSQIVNPSLQNLHDFQNDVDLQKNLKLAGIRYLFIEVFTRAETIRDTWDFDTPLTPISR